MQWSRAQAKIRFRWRFAFCCEQSLLFWPCVTRASGLVRNIGCPQLLSDRATSCAFDPDVLAIWPMSLPVPRHSLEPSDEARLLERLGAGDEAAFDTIVRAHSAALVTYAAIITGSHESAEEVVQDVLFEVWRRRDRLIITSSLRLYLYAAVRNRAINASQRARRRRRLQDTAEREAVTQGDVERPIEAEFRVREAEIDAAVRRAIDLLPSRCRVAYAYRWYHGLTYAEIADRLGVAVKTVEGQITAALKVLRKRLARVR
jgi:RNA polymerase sigma-70 factor, ECF subfamily